MSNVGKWDEHYANLTKSEPYGDVTTYVEAAEWMSNCRRIEDWGCGKGYFRQVLAELDPDIEYLGVDGSASPFADVVTDLTTYTSTSEGILLRHVLEHDYDWRKILDNAIASFTKKLIIVLFTPTVPETKVLKTEPDYGDVPVISFRLGDVLEPIKYAEPKTHGKVDVYQTGSEYGVETMIKVFRS